MPRSRAAARSVRAARPPSHRVERRVVADLEQVDVELARRVEARRERQRLGRAVGVLPEEGVGAEADHAVEPPSASVSGLVEDRDERVGVVGEAAEEQPVDARRRGRVSRPGPALPP